MRTITNRIGHPTARGVPSPQRGRSRRGSMRRYGSALTTTCLLVSCLGVAACVLGPRTFAHLEVDPSKFATIALRDDVEVKLTIIQTERAVTPRTRVYVLEYVEQENRKGFIPATESEYANLFLVRPAERSGTAGGIGRGRYLVVDLWHYYPAQGIKTCHQWTIWEDDPTAVRTRARLQFLVEDSNNVVLDARDVPLDPPTVKRLGAFYRRIKSVFAQRVHGLPIALPCGCGRPDPACGAQTSPVYSACQE